METIIFFVRILTETRNDSENTGRNASLLLPLAADHEASFCRGAVGRWGAVAGVHLPFVHSCLEVVCSDDDVWCSPRARSARTSRLWRVLNACTSTAFIYIRTYKNSAAGRRTSKSSRRGEAEQPKKKEK